MTFWSRALPPAAAPKMRSPPGGGPGDLIEYPLQIGHPCPARRVPAGGRCCQSRGSYADDQPASEEGAGAAAVEAEAPGHAGLPAEAGGLYRRQDDDPEEA